MKKNLLSVTLPKEWLQKIEADRGDVSRSRYLLRIVEHFYNDKAVAAGGSSQTK